MNSIYYDALDELSESVVRGYYSSSGEPPELVDIEGIVTEQYRLPIRYCSFAEDDTDKIGYISDGMTPLRIMMDRGPVSKLFPKGTIVIEKCLLEPQMSGRRRFTIAHEFSHYLDDRSLETACFSRVFDNERDYTANDLKALLSAGESKIDRLAAGLLMPRYILERNIKKITGNSRIPIYGNYNLDHEDRILAKRIANTMGVSMTALILRLRSLELFEYRDINILLRRIMPEGST